MTGGHYLRNKLEKRGKESILLIEFKKTGKGGVLKNLSSSLLGRFGGGNRMAGVE
jgi:hypothetical protein